MHKNIVSGREKVEATRLINEIWKAMVKGFQEIDPTLASQWGVRQPAPFIDAKTGNRGLSMHCDALHLSILVEKNMESGIYLLTAAHDDKTMEPITALQDPADIAQTLVSWVKDERQL